MRTRLLYPTDEGYTSPLDVASLYDGAFVQAFGNGYGAVAWDDIPGRIEWANFPARRPDGVFMPDVTGVIELEGHDNKVLYRFQGISLEPDADGRRLFSGPVRWFTGEPELAYLNDRWGFIEGQIDVETGRLRTAAYVLEPDPLD